MSLNEIWNSRNPEQLMYEELLKSKPRMAPLTLVDGSLRVEMMVSSDYLSIDGIRVSLRPKTAERVADYFGCILPTSVIVDQIWKHADLKVNPLSIKKNKGSFKSLKDHSQMIDEQILNKEFQILAGHKKDIILSDKIPKEKVIIYGWHRPDGTVVQSKSSIHSESYKDYSHGTRLISRKVIVNGKGYDIWECLGDDDIFHLLSEEKMKPVRYGKLEI